MSFDRGERPQREADSGGEAGGDAQRVGALAERGELGEAVDSERRRGREHGHARGALADRRQQPRHDDAGEQTAVNRRAARADRHRHVPQDEAALRDPMAEEAEQGAPPHRRTVSDGPGAENGCGQDAGGDRGQERGDDRGVAFHRARESR